MTNNNFPTTTNNDFSTTTWLSRLKIIPLKVSELKVGNYYRDILNNRLVRMYYIDEGGIVFKISDKDGDVSEQIMSLQYADGRFYDDGTIAQ